ncbi:MAG TPA: Ig-like domain-containing protein [Nitrospiria bacterium]|nr:Ig-like domain-containing protein [Nitrospiria bacterium]
MKKPVLSWITIVACIFFPMLFWGCGAIDPVPPPGLVSLSVTPVNTSIAPGMTMQFIATGAFSDKSYKNVTMSVTWSSSNTVVANVSNTSGTQGLATSTLTPGSTTITATSGSITGSTTLTSSAVVSISVTPASPPSLAPGTTQQFTAMGTLADSVILNLTTWATWSSLSPGIATISNLSGSQGLATAVAAPGTSTIRATYGGMIGTTTLTSSAVASIAVTPSAPSIPKGTTQQFIASATLVDSTVQSLTNWATWNSSNTGIATIGNSPGLYGLASGISVGPSNITASFSSITSNTALLTVTSAVVVSIAVTPANQSIALGNTQQFTAKGTFSDTTIQDITSLVTWSSSNVSVGTVSNVLTTNGLFTSLAQGTTGITAKLSGVTSNTATIQVTPPVLVSIAVTPTSPSILIGATQQFTATGTYSDGSMQDLTTSVNWVSAYTNIATISNALGSQGLATASFINTGITSITADMLGITSNSAYLTVHT